MAYKKLLELPNGLSAEYWRITRIVLDKQKPFTEIAVRGYKDKSVRDAVGGHIFSKIYSMPTNEINFSEDVYAQAYEYVADKIEDGEKSINPLSNTVPHAFFIDAEVV